MTKVCTGCTKGGRVNRSNTVISSEDVAKALDVCGTRGSEY